MSEGAIRRLWAAVVVALVACIVYWSLSPKPLFLVSTLSDKAGHALAYFTLALFSSGITSPERLRWTMFRCFLLGVALEVAQGALTGSRHPEWADLAANATGILAAWLIAGKGRAGWGLRAAAWLARDDRA